MYERGPYSRGEQLDPGTGDELVRLAQEIQPLAEIKFQTEEWIFETAVGPYDIAVSELQNSGDHPAGSGITSKLTITYTTQSGAELSLTMTTAEVEDRISSTITTFDPDSPEGETVPTNESAALMALSILQSLQKSPDGSSTNPDTCQSLSNEAYDALSKARIYVPETAAPNLLYAVNTHVWALKSAIPREQASRFKRTSVLHALPSSKATDLDALVEVTEATDDVLIDDPQAIVEAAERITAGDVPEIDPPDESLMITFLEMNPADGLTQSVDSSFFMDIPIDQVPINAAPRAVITRIIDGDEIALEASLVVCTNGDVYEASVTNDKQLASNSDQIPGTESTNPHQPSPRTANEFKDLCEQTFAQLSQ